MFKCLNGLAPAYLLHDFHYSCDFHTYNTRNKDLLRLPLAKTTKYQSSFRYNGAKAWNDLPYKLRIENSLSKFKKGLKLHFCTPNLVTEIELIIYIDLLTYLLVPKLFFRLVIYPLVTYLFQLYVN